jgi:hypothetical protein
MWCLQSSPVKIRLKGLAYHGKLQPPVAICRPARAQPRRLLEFVLRRRALVAARKDMRTDERSIDIRDSASNSRLCFASGRVRYVATRRATSDE